MQTGYPFTKEQWKELERQAAASSPLPIPTRLLPPIATSSPARVDLDPARCRRTDGKKWRCSKRVVSPNQKYCERHVNRGRPRSQASIASANHKTPRHRQPYSFPSPSFYPRLQTKNMEWIVRVRPEKDEEQTYLNLATENPSPLFLNFDSNPNPSYSEPLQTKTKVNDLMNLGVGNSWVSPLAEVLRSAVGFGDGSDYSPADYP